MAASSAKRRMTPHLELPPTTAGWVYASSFPGILKSEIFFSPFTSYLLPPNPRLREASKIKLWATYLRAHGRNLTLLRYPQCTRLVQVGLPNRLRGEMWEALSGSMFLRFAHPGFYAELLAQNEGRTSTSTEDIEKDLHRSLPEYAGYQSEEGISALGYC